MSMTRDAMTIRSLHHDYEVTFDQEIASLKSRLAAYDGAYVVIDTQVLDLYRESLIPIIKDRPILEVPATESFKTLDGVTETIDWLLGNHANRSSVILGIGGGIIQDVVTFVSNIYYRGTRFILVPTTLLSMSDSSIGAKCGINYGTFKNQLGVIHAPSAVHICAEFLDSLSELDVKSGYGEILKLSITGSEAATKSLFSIVDKQGLRGPHLLDLIRQSLEVKKLVIEEDEYESDLRRILNYGHTFGHALEALTNHAIPHGLAVTWGMDLINFLSLDVGPLARDLYQSTHNFIDKHLSFSLAQFPSASELIEMIKRDKKMGKGVINLAIPAGYGQIEIVPTQIDRDLLKKVEQYLASSNVYA